ncbi:hypothetical protein KKI24_14280 [bacterium]|nr:hypothetical protein [bacterium]
MKRIILAAILLLFSVTSIQAAGWWCGVRHFTSKEAAEICRKRENLDLKKQEKIVAKQEKALEAPIQTNDGSQSGNTGTILNLGPALGGGGSESSGASEYPREAKFEIGFNLPFNFIFPFQQGAPGYMFSTQISQVRLQYNFAEYMHFGGSYIDQKIEAERFKDTKASYYENKHFILYMGFRGWMTEKNQMVVNWGITDSDSYPEGEDSPGFKMGIFTEIQYLWVYDSMKIGPSLTVVIASADNADYLKDNEKASFIRFGINASVGIPGFGYVGQ